MSARIGFHCQVVHWCTVPVHQHDVRKSWDADGKQCGVATALTDGIIVRVDQQIDPRALRRVLSVLDKR
jgi:hypothetical protein